MKSFPLHLRSFHAGSIKSRLSPHKSVVWWIAFACAVFGVMTGLHLIIVPTLSGYSFWIVLGGLILLLVSTK